MVMILIQVEIPRKKITKLRSFLPILQLMIHTDRNLARSLNHLMAINVPDSDFHDFDMNQTESSSGDNQVWSAYDDDDDDGMPRFYA